MVRRQSLPPFFPKKEIGFMRASRPTPRLAHMVVRASTLCLYHGADARQDVVDLLEPLALVLVLATPKARRIKPVETVLEFSLLRTCARSIDFSWYHRGGFTFPSARGQITVRRLGAVVGIALCAVYDEPAEAAVRTFDEVLGRRLVESVLEQILRSICVRLGRVPAKVAVFKS